VAGIKKTRKDPFVLLGIFLLGPVSLGLILLLLMVMKNTQRPS